MPTQLFKHKFSTRSFNNLQGVDPRLAILVSRALLYSPLDFGITEGLRTMARQKQLVAEGKSKTLKSKHLIGKAVDVVAYIDGHATWDLEHYRIVADAFKKASEELNIPIQWGGDWNTFKDGPHFELI